MANWLIQSELERKETIVTFYKNKMCVGYYLDEPINHMKSYGEGMGKVSTHCADDS